MNYYEFTNSLNKEVEINFKNKLKELIKETKNNIKEHKKKLNLGNDDNSIQHYINIMFENKNRLEFIEWNYHFIKYCFYKYENNDTLENNHIIPFTTKL
jgi:hypothetical protein